LRSLLERDKKENVKLEKQRNAAKEANAKAKEDLEMLQWTFAQQRVDLQNQKETWASTEADVITNDLTNSDKTKLVNHLGAHKNDFRKNLEEMIAKKQKKLALLESQLKEITSYGAAHQNNVDELTRAMRGLSDALKKKMVELVRLESIIRELQSQKRIEALLEQKWADKCGPYEGHDPYTYATNKEADQIRSREAELEIRFKKIYDDTVDQMIEQSEKDNNSAAEKKRQNDVEKQSLEAQTKELKGKRVLLVNELNTLDNNLIKANKELQALENQIHDLEIQIPILEQALADALQKLQASEAEMKTLAAKAEKRDKHCAGLRALLKEKQEQATKSKIEEDKTLNDLKLRLQDKRQRLEEANIGLFPEISKYRGLVDVAEVKLTPNKKQKRTTM